MQYRSEVISVAGFVQQIACSYLRHGYWFYVTGRIPAGKDAEAIDRKLIEKYDIAVSESTRARRKQLGMANLQYLRHDRFFVIFATKGTHRFFAEEGNSVRDMRKTPLRFADYSISYRRGGRTREGERDHRWHAHVEIERKRYLEIKAHFLCMALHPSPDNLTKAFVELPFEPYAPIRRQLLNLLRSVNQARSTAGYSPLPLEVLALRRRIVKPFGEVIRHAPEVVKHKRAVPPTNRKESRMPAPTPELE